MGDYGPVLLFLLIAIGLAGTMVVLATLLGPKRRSIVKGEVFECGQSPISTPRQRFSVKFYLVAVLFIIFDVEAVFLFPWATVFQKLGWFGFWEMTIFLLVLAVGLAYAWRKGALEWS